MTQVLKSKRLRIYNFEEVKHRVFSRLEVPHLNELAEKIADVLENNYEIKNKYLMID